MLFAFIFLFCLTANALGSAAHYVDSTKADGTHDGTFANAFQTIAQVNAHSFDQGDDLYFKVGQTWSPSAKLTIDWEGVEGDHVIIGAWEAENDFTLEGGETLPIIDGNAHTVPTYASWAALIENTAGTGDWVDIENIKVNNSGCMGIRLSQVDNVSVKNCYIYRSKRNGIIFSRVNNGTISYNTVEQASYLVSPMAGITVTGEDYEGSCINNTVSYNKVFYCYEGIGVYRKANDSKVEYNEVYDNRSYHIYLGNSQRNIVRYNLVYSTGSGEIPRKRLIVTDDEQWLPSPYCYSEDHEIYGNLIAGGLVGINPLISYGNGVSCVNSGFKVYNNTIVDCVTNFSVSSNGSGCEWSSSEFKNNLIVKYDIADAQVSGCSEAGWTFATNDYWGGTPPSGTCSGGFIHVNPALNKLSGWTNLSPAAVAAAWFQLTASTPVSIAEGGADLGTSLEYVLIPDTCDFIASPITCTSANADNYTWPIGAFLALEAGASGTLTTGFAGSNVSESQIVAGAVGGSPITIILTLSGTTWDATLGGDNAVSTAFIQGFDSAQAEAGGWNATIRDVLTFAVISRDSDTQATLTVPATAGYSITANETITVTIDSSCIAYDDIITADNTLTISNETPTVAGSGLSYSSSGRTYTHDATGVNITIGQ